MQPGPNSGVGTAVPPGPPALVYMPAPVRSNVCDGYKHRQSIGLGITQIIISILCVIFNAVCIAVTSHGDKGNGLGVVGHGFWCGIMFLITGIFGVVAGKKKTRCMIVTFMVFCILSALFTISLLTVGILGAIFTDREDCYSQVDYSYNYNNYGYGYSDYYPYYRWVCYNVPNYKVIIAMEACLALAGLVEVIVAIWGSALCCGSGVCCCSRPAMAMPAPGYNFPTTGQMICISQTQGGPYIYAPQPTFAFPQGLAPPPAYAQPTWTNVGPVYGQAPPAYANNQVQPLWMIQPAAGNPAPLGVHAQAPPLETKA